MDGITSYFNNTISIINNKDMGLNTNDMDVLINDMLEDRISDIGIVVMYPKTYKAHLEGLVRSTHNSPATYKSYKVFRPSLELLQVMHDNGNDSLCKTIEDYVKTCNDCRLQFLAENRYSIKNWYKEIVECS